MQLNDLSAAERQKLAADNRGLVGHIAKIYTGRGVEFEELVAAGNVGLCVASMKYEEDRNVRFTTYASFWIKREILASIRDNRLVRITRRVPHGWALPIWQAAQSRQEYTLSRGEYDFDPVDHRDDGRHEEAAEVRDLVSKYVDAGRDREIMRLRLDGCTLKEIGRRFGISRERVAQVQRCAIRKIQRQMGIGRPVSHAG